MFNLSHFCVSDPCEFVPSSFSAADARKTINKSIFDGCTRIAAEIATVYGLEAEYPGLIAQYNKEQMQLYATA